MIATPDRAPRLALGAVTVVDVFQAASYQVLHAEFYAVCVGDQLLAV